MNITQEQIMGIQRVLVQIWQKQVQMWYETTDSPDPPANPDSPDATTDTIPVINHATNSAATNATDAPTIKRDITF